MEGFDFCCVAWKRRTGLRALGAAFTSSVSKWEPRTLAIVGTSLCYFENGQEDGAPRGALDVIEDKVTMNIVAKQQDDAPTKHEVDVHAVQAGKKVLWKFCFDQQEDLMRCLSSIHNVLDSGGAYKQKKIDRFEHDFTAGDHIYRWEMIVMPPVIYPVQIHAIVLEAGRNCIVVADFGLTGYSKKEGEEFNHVDDRHDSALALAWKKLRPNSDERITIVTLIDQKEIRKWTKAKYDEESFFNSSKHSKAFETMTNWWEKLRLNLSSDELQSVDESSECETSSPAKSEGSATSPSSKPAPQELPQSDPTEIVLARANYVLEHMDKLPPYHVFYSNSECIAVWCKTGRWSTLQTAVFLSTNSVGAAKSSTLATIGVAAANPLLAPVVAIGGLVWVTAPMVILKKSRDKWEEYTASMTDLFWASAPSRAFVAAIQHWSGLGVEEDANGVAKELKHELAAEALPQPMRLEKALDESIATDHETTETQADTEFEDNLMPLAPPPAFAPPPPPPPQFPEESEEEFSDPLAPMETLNQKPHESQRKEANEFEAESPLPSSKVFMEESDEFCDIELK